ncbi:branchpoint-bridging protein [Apodospora peruviana]|uniref:Branchpoint-bridging protein n=1 Tax=Apodospora peruviana TaxID=516989 RepID=A0AAE0IBF8_9PEZI|nr:branchpoint-bridging protein [Apodospora peruviana]
MVFTTRSSRPSRWGPADQSNSQLKTLTLAIEAPITAEQIEAYALHVRIEEITHQLIRMNNNVLPATDSWFHRSPSLPPEYDAHSGRRINTHQHRYQERLLSKSVTHLFNRPSEKKEKVYILVKDFPEVNFIGQILGPRSRSLGEMITLSGAEAIVLRGKGSVKEGRCSTRGCRGRPGDDGGRGGRHHFDHDNIDKAKVLINEIIEIATTMPEHANDRKRDQLRTLAVINGNFRDDEANKHAALFSTTGHYSCKLVACYFCGGYGHIARDCKKKSGHIAQGEEGSSKAPSPTPPWRKTSGNAATNNADSTSIGLLYSEFLSDL